MKTSDYYFYAAKAMIFSGGSFAACIGEAYIVADPSNTARLIDAFGDLFERYAQETTE